ADHPGVAREHADATLVPGKPAPGNRYVVAAGNSVRPPRQRDRLIWRRDANGAMVVGASIAVSLVMACLFGFSVPSLLHWLKLDPKIAAGPVTLAVTDFFALAFYFSLAWMVLG